MSTHDEQWTQPCVVTPLQPATHETQHHLLHDVQCAAHTPSTSSNAGGFYNVRGVSNVVANQSAAVAHLACVLHTGQHEGPVGHCLHNKYKLGRDLEADVMLKPRHVFKRQILDVSTATTEWSCRPQECRTSCK